MADMSFRYASVSLGAWQSATQARIDSQIKIVAECQPSSDAHRIATSVLLMLQDSLFVLTHTKVMVDAVRPKSTGDKLA